MTESNIENAHAAMQAIAMRQAETLFQYLDQQSYIDHDPLAAGDSSGIDMFLQSLGSRAGSRIVRTVANASNVMIQSEGGCGTGDTLFDVFRFDHGAIVERWAFSAKGAPPNKSGHTQIDGQSAPEVGDGSQASLLIREYYEAVHIGGGHDLIPHYVSHEHLIRYEPGVADGLDEFVKDVAALSRERSIDKIVLLVAERDLVFLAAKGSHKGEMCAYVDLYRVQGCKITEHWGFPEPILSIGTRINRHPML